MRSLSVAAADDVHPEVDEEALAETPLLLEVPVVPEDDKASELDRHAVILPTLDRGRDRERLDGLADVVRADDRSAPRERRDRCRRPTRQRSRSSPSASPSTFPSVLFRDTPTSTGRPSARSSSSRRSSSRFWSGVLPKPMPGIDADPFLANSALDGERETLLQEGQHIAHHVVVLGSGLHRPRLALHVHETQERVSLRDDLGHAPGRLGGRSRR